MQLQRGVLSLYRAMAAQQVFKQRYMLQSTQDNMAAR